MPVQEFLGPNQDAAEGHARALRILEGVRYQHADRKVIVSTASLPCGDSAAVYLPR